MKGFQRRAGIARLAPCEVVLFCAVSASCFATAPVVVFDSFGPGNTYKTTVVWGVSGAASPNGYRGQAEWFVPGISGNLSAIQLATYRSSGSGRSNFFIAEDNGSGIPGSIHESYLNVLNNPNGLLTLSSVTHPWLQSGVKYWVCDEPADSTTINGWFQNNQNHAPGFAFERSQWSWESWTFNPPPSGVFRVSVTPVPEPSTVGLAILGVCFLIRRSPNRSVVK